MQAHFLPSLCVAQKTVWRTGLFLLALITPIISPSLAMATDTTGDRAEMVLTNLPTRGSTAYKNLLTLAGKENKVQILRMTKSEMWSMPTGRAADVLAMCPKLGVRSALLGNDWNHILKPTSDATKMTDAQASVLDATKSAPTAMHVGLVAAPPSALVEYALTRKMRSAGASRDTNFQTSTIIIPIGSDETVTVKRTGVMTNAAGCTWRGVIETTGEAVMLMWWKGGQISGMFTYRGRPFAVKNIGGEIHAVIEGDPAKMPPDHGPIRSGRATDPNLQDDRIATRGEAALMRHAPDFKSRQDGVDNRTSGVPLFKPMSASKRRDLAAKKVIIDVMVAYTKKAARSYANIENDLIAVAIEQSNASFRNSGIGKVQLRLVHKYLTDYDEGDAQHFDHLYRMVDKGDGHMEEVLKLRDDVRADVVVLVVDDGTGCGLSTRVAADAEEAFAVVHHACAAMTYSLVHEIGHILGARHDRSLDPSALPFPYGHGYVHGTKWRDIMSYKASCNGCPRLPIWSNPTITVRGDPGGTVNEDNARVILEQAQRVSKFR